MSHPKYGGDSRVEGLTGDIDPTTGELMGEAYQNPALLQTFRPFFTEEDVPLASDLPHGREEVARQMGMSPVTGSYSMRGFAASYFHEHPEQAGPYVTKPDCMRMMTPKAIPVTAFLAKNFMVCDHWFCAIPTDTHPNRMMALSGYTEIDGTSSFEPDQYLVVDWAEANNVPWRVYSDDFSFMMCLKDKTTGALRGVNVLKERATNGKYRGFSSFAHDFQYDKDFPKVTLIEPAYSDDPLAMEPNDNHPPLPMGPGEAFLLKIYNAFFGTQLARERFNKTLMLVYYDEHGGFFDHVPPIKVLTPSGRAGTGTQWLSFSTTGPRVPAIVVSPRVNPGVFKNNMDHTSALRFLAERFTPSKPFNAEVTARHTPRAGEGLASLGNVIDRSDARAVPAPPSVGMLPTASYPNGRPAKTPGQEAFLNARKHFHEDAHDETAAAHPEAFFALPHH
jgi:phospholipase C